MAQRKARRRAGFWDGKQFWSRLGNRFHAPDWFVAGLPGEPLDGELWLDRKQFQRTVSIVRRQDKSDHWKQVRYVVFDAPKLDKDFEKRLAFVQECLADSRPPYALAHAHQRCQGVDHLRSELDRLEALGGGGPHAAPGGLPVRERPVLDAAQGQAFPRCRGEGAQAPGRCRPAQGPAGGLVRRVGRTGPRFSVGTGFSDAQREVPPPVGSTITFRYQELSEAGVPRFPSFVGVRAEAAVAAASPKKAKVASSPAQVSAPAKRRFEFVEGTSSKFWEIALAGHEVTVRYGRIGTSGQASTKSFTDIAAAARHAEKLIAEKTGKGYREVP